MGGGYGFAGRAPGLARARSARGVFYANMQTGRPAQPLTIHREVSQEQYCIQKARSAPERTEYMRRGAPLTSYAVQMQARKRAARAAGARSERASVLGARGEGGH